MKRALLLLASGRYLRYTAFVMTKWKVVRELDISPLSTGASQVPPFPSPSYLSDEYPMAAIHLPT
jgi:hypothetical protein